MKSIEDKLQEFREKITELVAQREQAERDNKHNKEQEIERINKVIKSLEERIKRNSL